MCFRLNYECSHVVFNILLHKQIVITVFIKQLILIIAFHDFIHSVIIVEVE